MANRSLQGFRRVVTVTWPQHQDATGKAFLLKTARNGHAKIMAEQTARAGIAPDFEAYANSPGNANLDSVIVPGPIVFKYRYVREIVSETIRALRAASPAASGDYVRSHTIFVNGAAVDQLPPRLKAGDEIMIANSVPYARRVEVGKTKSGRDFLIQVPNRIYQRTGALIHKRYGKLAKITVEFIDLPSAYRLRRNQATRSFSGGALRVGRQRSDRRAGSKITYPAIIIEA